MEDLRVVGVVAELVGLPAQVGSAPVVDRGGVAARPGVLACGVERGTREIQAHAAPRGWVDDLRLQASHHPEGLRITLEAADRLGQPIEFAFAVVTEGRVAQVVSESGDVDEIGVAAQGRAHLTGDLCDLKRVRQARAGEVGAASHEHLRGGRQAAKPSGVQHARAVSREGRALARAVMHPPLDVGGGVARWDVHALTLVATPDHFRER